jgi:LysM repeat protein
MRIDNSSAASNNTAANAGNTSGYTVSRGDTISAIAHRYGISPQALLAANPDIRNPDIIFVGDTLSIPTASREVTVQPGDTLSAIAQRNGATVQALAQANNIDNPNRIYPGDRLRIPGSSAASSLPSSSAPTGSGNTTGPNGLPANGDPGNRTLTAADWQRAAKALGVDVAAIKAVAQVEAAGAGFMADGRPKILFEAHIFSDKTNGKYDRSNPNISSARWNRDLYSGGAGEYPRLQQAMGLDRNAALQSASWGKFQIMGFNYKAAGYSSVEAFVQDMYKSEGKQLDAFVNFIKADPAMHSALKRHDWAGFAQSYNGSGYAANHYDTKMRDAYNSLK